MEKSLKRDILCIDLRGFFASVECVSRGLDPFKTPLIVADTTRGNGGIVLAVSPYLRARGVPTRRRLYEMPVIQDLIIAKPSMRQYIDVSSYIITRYLEYVSSEDLHPYSIDEAFLDVTDYLNYHKKSPYELAQTIMNDVLNHTGISAAIGIGDNPLQSKLALDLYSKKVPTGIAEMRTEHIETLLHPVRPLSKMWGIGPRMEKRLNFLNIFSVDDLAHADRRRLKRLFGVIGEELHDHAWGKDDSRISDKSPAHNAMKSVGLSQTLYQDYTINMAKQALREMCDETGFKLRKACKLARNIHIGVGYSKLSGGGFSRQMNLAHPTNDPDVLYEYAERLFDKHVEPVSIRQLHVRAQTLCVDDGIKQLNLHENSLRTLKRAQLWQTIDCLRERYGKTTLARASSFVEDSSFIERAALIGGHHG